MLPQLNAVTALRLWFLPVQTRMPLKFGTEVLTSVLCARVCLRVRGDNGAEVEGWGETPLSVQWVWPSPLPFAWRLARLQEFCRRLAAAWIEFPSIGHPLAVGHRFQQHILPALLAAFNQELHNTGAVGLAEPLPRLAGLVCLSPFDLALHDAFGQLAERPIYELYKRGALEADLAHFLEPDHQFDGRYPSDFLVQNPPQTLPVWHLVGGLDPLTEADLTSDQPHDAEPVVLRDWIQRDGLKCLKIKLRGNDSAWDYERITKVAGIGREHGAACLSVDFNCTVQEPAYVTEILDQLARDEPLTFQSILYVEQPFAYDLERNQLDVHSVSQRKPLFLDESAHDWKMIRLGRELGWTGVALKTCKTQTGAILSACWARAHGLQLMVQDLTNPMLAQISHVQLAAHVGTIKGVESNAMQFYPAASRAEAAVHPGVYQRRQGKLDLSTLGGPGFGYQVERIARQLPPPELSLRFA